MPPRPGSPRPKRTKRTKPASKGRPKFIYTFREGEAEGDRDQKNLLGGKGANLAEMCRLGLPVPPGFTITTEVCSHFHDRSHRFPPSLRKELNGALDQLEKSMGKRFGDPTNPLLVSVRSGARVSMPGMMDTVLNLGLNDETVDGLANLTENPRFAWDAYRRFIQMYSDVVLEVRAAKGETQSPFTRALDDLKRKRGVTEDTELEAQDWMGLVRTYKSLVKKATGKPFPQDPQEQLWGAIGAVFHSWNNERAIAYRSMHMIPSKWGTAVTIMTMVYGNMGDTSGTGVAFTRDPSTGEKRFYGEFLMNAQGEDVVAGLRTPKPISNLLEVMPKAYAQLERIQRLLEGHYRDMQDLEFTIEQGRLFMLQCRAGKRTGFAAVRIATDLVKERKITQKEALLRVDPEALDQLLQPVFDRVEQERARKDGRVLTRGLNAGPGAASGRIAFTPAEAIAYKEAGEKSILVRLETSPEDIRGMQASMGILTVRGGMTSHAALVGRQMGKVCVVGAAHLRIEERRRTLRVGERRVSAGEWISIDGTTGEVFVGQLATQPSQVTQALLGKGKRAERAAQSPTFKAYSAIMRWADKHRSMAIRANADQPDQCRVATAFGAQGIGLCRTEHMFFGEKKIGAMREMILADDAGARKRALAKLLPLQRRDFEGIFMAMGRRPVTIRTLDPPLHEFLPHEKPAQRELAKKLGLKPSDIAAKVESLTELNPMLGHRGCRLGITFPEITQMQVRAVFEAACNVAKRTGKKPRVELMIPLIASSQELEVQEPLVRATVEEVFAKKGIRVPFLVGTMIELPRAALVADAIARTAEFFSFGTNDLTQTTFGISRDDAGKFIPEYIQEGIYAGDPFASLDTRGVGRLMEMAVEQGRATRPEIKLGICGEHGGDPRSIDFCEALGLAYVSCSPYRIPIARLAAAQAALRA